MKQNNDKKMTKVIMIIGILLIMAALVMVAFHHFSLNQGKSEGKRIAGVLYELMPELEPGDRLERMDYTMPSAEVEGVDYLGVIEIPDYDCMLPVRSDWKKSKVMTCPSRYMGSTYDGSLIIGGSDGEGQLDFIQNLTFGTCITVTDMMGKQYTYEIDDFYRTKDVSSANLKSEDHQLVLFVKHIYGTDYTLIQCRQR